LSLVRRASSSTLFPYTTLFRSRLLTDEVSQRITLRLLNGAVSEADVMPADPPKGLSKDVTSGGAASAARYRYTLFGLYDLSLAVDRKSTRLNSSHEWISYAVFC